MNQNIEIGKINTLLIDRITPPGIFLVALDGEAILLPNRYVTDDMKVYDKISVFVYTDSEDRLIATTITPTAMADEFGYFEVVGATEFGSFINIGLMKDILVPKNRQKNPFRIGDKKILRIIVDENTNRLIGDERILRYLSNDISTLNQNDEVKLLIFAKTPLGYKAIINNSFEGMLFSNEIFKTIKIGDTIKGYIKNIREDGKIDLSLQPTGTAKKDNAAEKIMELLNKKEQMPFTYKSEAEDISKVFGISKKAFKAALTILIETKQISLEANCIRKL